MKKTQPSFNNNLPVLNLQWAAAVAGGNTGTSTDATKTTAPVYSTNNSEAPTIPGGNGGRPPFV